MKLTRSDVVDGKELFVFDSVLSSLEQRRLGHSLESLAYTRSQADSVKHRSLYTYYAFHISNKDALNLRLMTQLQKLVRLHFPQDRTRLKSCYINRIEFGDMSFIHRDCESHERHITAIYFGHSNWHPDWGGETIFFNRQKDARILVSPKPRRLILFRGSIWHKIGLPTRLCTKSRFSIAAKFDVR